MAWMRPLLRGRGLHLQGAGQLIRLQPETPLGRHYDHLQDLLLEMGMAPEEMFSAADANNAECRQALHGLHPSQLLAFSRRAQRAWQSDRGFSGHLLQHVLLLVWELGRGGNRCR